MIYQFQFSWSFIQSLTSRDLMRHSESSFDSSFSVKHILMISWPEEEQNLRTLSETKEQSSSVFYIYSVSWTWSLPRKTLTPECLALEEGVHVAPEGVAELLCLWMLMLRLVPVVIVGVSGALEGGGGRKWRPTSPEPLGFDASLRYLWGVLISVKTPG